MTVTKTKLTKDIKHFYKTSDYQTFEHPIHILMISQTSILKLQKGN